MVKCKKLLQLRKKITKKNSYLRQLRKNLEFNVLFNMTFRKY